MNKKAIRAAVIFILLLIPLINVVSSAIGSRHPDSGSDDVADTSVLSSIEQVSVSDIEKVIDGIEEEKHKAEVQQQLSEQRQAGINAVLSQISDGTTSYRQIFRNVLIVGDSLMRGLQVYGVLDSSNMLAQVNASLTNLSDNMSTIINNNPKVLILHYGINMIGTTQAHLNSYIKQYTTLVTKLKSSLPNTRIVISGLFPTSSAAASKAARFQHVSQYNTALKKMCSDNGLTFLDNSTILSGHTDMYEKDGIHFKKVFYTKLWLPYVTVQLKL